MRTETITKEIYTFDELSDDAKETAIEKYRESYDDFSFDAECIIEDAKQIGELIGITIEKVYYTGFWSQGDGACFVGTYQYKKGGLKALKQYAPMDQELHRIAKELQQAQSRYFYRISAEITHSFRYYHSRSVDISIDSGNGYYRQDVNERTEEQISEALRDLMEWIYKQLQTQYEYITSDEAISETLRDNGYEYDEDGSMV